MITPLLFVATQALPAQEGVHWELLIRDRDNRGLFIDPTSISRNGDIVHFTGRIDGRVAGSPETRFMIIRAAIDCGRRSIAMLAGDAYAEDGRRIATRRIQPSEVTYEAIGRDQGFSLFHTRVCSAPAAFPSLPAPDAVQWELLASVPEGRLLIDPASIARNGDVVQFTGRIDASPARPPGTRIMIVRIAIDCRRHTFAMLAGDAYGEGGARTGSRRVLPGQIRYEPIGPEGTALFEPHVCVAPRH